MGQVVLLVVAAAWAAVLVPPLLRSRVENRPNSSVTDFRRQLNRLQSTVPTRASGSLRPVGRQLAPSPLSRRAVSNGPAERATVARSHNQPNHAAHRVISGSEVSSHRHEPVYRGGPSGAQRHRAQPRNAAARAAETRRRRTNVLFMLVMCSISTLFLAATTKASLMLYLFAISFLALCGYIYMLAQIRQREAEQSGYESLYNARLRR
jgi:hypothetical protein